MALNCSSCSTFPIWSRHVDDFVSTRRDICPGGFTYCSWSSSSFPNPYDYGAASFGWLDNDDDDNGCFDIVDLLPADPFEMGIGSRFNSTFASFVGDHVITYDYRFGEEYLLSELDKIHLRNPSASSQLIKDTLYCSFDSGNDDRVGGFTDQASTEDHSEIGFYKSEESCCSEAEMSPHPGLLFSLGYLNLKDLLSMERVCRSLHSAVQDDELLWRSICIDPPLSLMISDDDLMCLTQRAQGRLTSLGLFGCSRITEEGLKHVLESNPKLKKLSIPGCLRLNLENLIHTLRALKCSGVLTITHLRLGRMFSVTPENYKDLKFILDLDELQHPRAFSLRFYHSSFSSLACDDDCAIDIEMCPGCQKLKIVYDCPSEDCRTKQAGECRACDVCIARCVQCGKCIRNCEYEETFCLENLCSGCWKQPLKCLPTEHLNNEVLLEA